MRSTGRLQKAESMRILVVEDNATDLKLIRSVLTGAGHMIRGAASAEQALEMLAAERPQVILTDLDLPCMDGLTMTRRLKLAEATKSIPVIAITSYPDQFAGGAIRSAGFAGYFTKPINTRTLSRQVAEAVMAA